MLCHGQETGETISLIATDRHVLSWIVVMKESRDVVNRDYERNIKEHSVELVKVVKENTNQKCKLDCNANSDMSFAGVSWGVKPHRCFLIMLHKKAIWGLCMTKSKQNCTVFVNLDRSFLNNSSLYPHVDLNQTLLFIAEFVFI